MAIKEGEWIEVEYTGTFEDGSVFDSTDKQGGNPLKFQVGAGQIIPGFDTSVVGKSLGDEYDITLEPSDAYGEYQENLIQKVSKSQFPPDVEPKPGMQLLLMGPNNQPIPAMIDTVEENAVIIDLNHPLAGKILNFKIKIVGTDCEPGLPSACGCGCDHGPDGHQGCC